MSDSDEKKTFRRKGKSDKSSDDGKPKISPPEINLPAPDEFNTSMTDATVKRADARARAKAEKQRKKNKKRSHPTDSYEPVRKNSKGCCGCFVMVVIVFLLAVGGSAFYLATWAVAPYKNAGYEMVSVKNGSKDLMEITEAPDIETHYMVPLLKYSAETTPKKVVFVGADVTISGTFADKVTFKGGKLTIEEGTVFESDLEVYAAQMLDKGSTCKGELTGSVMMQK